jgi:uncharacterized protein YdhG (YjbR/CyaY superfamily)
MRTGGSRRCCNLSTNAKIRRTIPRSMKKRPTKGSRKETKSPRFNSVEEYLASLDPTKERTLRSVIDLILTQFRELESKISWNVPTIHRNGKYVVGVSAYKKHLTFSAWSPRVIEDFKVRLGKFVVFKNCFQIPVDWKIDRKLVKDLVRARLAELD